MMDGRMKFNVSAFHQTFKNYPYRAPNGVYYVNTAVVRDNLGNITGTRQEVAQFNFVAAVPVKVKGIEADLAFDINDNWNMGLVASYTVGKIKNGTIPCTDINGDGVPDVVTSAPSLATLQGAVGANNLSACTVSQRASFQAPFTATLQSEYSMAVSDHVDGYLRGLVSYNGKSQTDPTSIYDDVGAYALANLYAGVRDPDGAWEVSLFAKNLFDTTKTLSRTNPLSTSYQVLNWGGAFDGNGRPVFTGASPVTTTSPYTGVTTTPPREFGVNVRFSFGSR